jgi:fimbrial chaperone protein
MLNPIPNPHNQPQPHRGLRLGAWLVGLVAGAVVCSAAVAGPFEVAVSPTRLTITGNAGQRLGQSLKIYNLGAEPTSLSFRTLDWTFSETGELKFHDELLPGSCRPWVSLERRTSQMTARSDASFRFQVDVPAGAPRGECRFMIAVEGVDPAQQALINSGGASLNLPVSGRIAVAVYLAVGGAKPKLELQQIGTDSLKKERLPVVRVTNTGDAHGRLDGVLEVTNADGKTFELVPDGGPILPGQTRMLALNARSIGKETPPALQYPLKLEGTLDWDQGAFKVQATLP